MTKLTGFRMDWEMAYRQDATSAETAGIFMEAAWCHPLQKIVLIEPIGQSFGNRAAQLNFVRHPHFVVHVVRCLYAIPMSYYSDDMWDIEAAQTCDCAFHITTDIMVWSGWRWDK